MTLNNSSLFFVISIEVFSDSRDNEVQQKVKWGHVMWVCTGNEFVL